MRIIIHRGAHEIGGSCIEVRLGENRILLDMGMPLMGRDGNPLDQVAVEHPSRSNGILPDIEGLYKDQPPFVSAVIVSHAHLDHYGLLDQIHNDIPIYASKESRVLIETGNIFSRYRNGETKRVDDIITFDHWKPFNVGPFRITSYLMDHSAFGASSLLIESEGKRIFYTGDLRDHGRKNVLFERLLKAPFPSPDCLLMEGTTLSGQHDVGYASETEVESELFRVFSSQKDVSFVLASGSNIDRIVSLYRATKRARRTLVLDLYQYHLLSQLRSFAPGLPPHPGDHIRVRYLRNHAQAIVETMGESPLYEYKPRRITPSDIMRRRNEMVLRLPLSDMQNMARRMEQEKPLENANFIYSMWTGYRERNTNINEFASRHGILVRTIHTSGHAYLAALKRLTEALKPMTVIPIHTLAGDEYDRHFEHVVRIDDGAAFQL